MIFHSTVVVKINVLLFSCAPMSFFQSFRGDSRIKEILTLVIRSSHSEKDKAMSHRVKPGLLIPGCGT